MLYVDFTPPEETERGPEAGLRGGVPGGVGSKNRGGQVRVYRGGLSPIANFLSVCPSVGLSVWLSPRSGVERRSMPLQTRAPVFSIGQFQFNTDGEMLLIG